MRVCPFAACETMVAPTQFACPKHWASLTKGHKARVWSAYKQYLAKTISLLALRNIQQQILKEAQG